MDPKLLAILSAFGEALDFWLIYLNGPVDELRRAISPATVASPMEELVKVTILLRAHITKVGILFERLSLQRSGTVTAKIVVELSSSFLLLMSLLARISPAEISRLFYMAIATECTFLVENTRQLISELEILVEKAKVEELAKETKDSEQTKDINNETQKVEAKETQEGQKLTSQLKGRKVDTRLVSVGKVWSSCDQLVKLVDGGKVKYLEKQVKILLSLIEDGLDEFSEWAENPETLDDPFFLEDDFSDEEVPPSAGEESEKDDFSEEKQRLSSYCKLWLEKFKLVRLLFLSINKSLPALVCGESIDQIYEAQELISRGIDLLIVDLMLSQAVDLEVAKHAATIDKGCYTVVKILKRENEKSSSKVKWCDLWESKYQKLLDKMYD